VIKIENLQVELGKFRLRDINLTVADGEYCIILGPTGAGKTILLESLAGLNPLKKGRIWLDGRDITAAQPEKRGISIVYQDHALFPHLSVRDNILYGLKLRRASADEIRNTLDWLTGLLGISHLLPRKPDTLSGGERQKVALARALSTRPVVLLLDEPLSALDQETREGIQEELRMLHDSLKNTVIHVTHDFEEAMALGTRIAVIGEGRLMQVGTPEQIFRQPESPFVARFSLTRNIFSGEVIDGHDGNPIFRLAGLDLKVFTDLKGPCYAAIRPEDILIFRNPVASNMQNVMAGAVTRITDRGATLNISLNLPPEITALLTRHQFMELGIKSGDRFYISLNPLLIHIFKEK
jgi:ABC-type Fe3+/spermidine/putrescine transport system ATPase subunit